MKTQLSEIKKILDKAKLFFKQAKFSRKQVSRLDYFYLSLLAQLRGQLGYFFQKNFSHKDLSFSITQRYLQIE